MPECAEDEAPTVTFTVLGHPEPAGSKRAFAIRKGGELTGKVSVSDANPNGKVWQAEVRNAAAQALVRVRYYAAWYADGSGAVR